MFELTTTYWANIIPTINLERENVRTTQCILLLMSMHILERYSSETHETSKLVGI